MPCQITSSFGKFKHFSLGSSNTLMHQRPVLFEKYAQQGAASTSLEIAFIITKNILFQSYAYLTSVSFI